MAIKPVISVKLVTDIFEKINLKCPYDFGSKWNLDAPVWDRPGRKVDCSGFVRWILFKASNGKFTLPDGSQIQWERVEELGWKKLGKYTDLKFAAGDTRRLFICFCKPVYIGKKLLKAGHVWLCVSQGGKMRTIESWGGKGVSSRKFNMLVFLARGAVAYEVPTVEAPSSVWGAK